MSLASWLRPWSLISGKRSRRLRQATPPRPWLTLERLEDRCVPTTVTNTNDTGPGSLRQAVLNTGWFGTVDFQPGLGTIVLASEISIMRELTINGGAGVTISGNNVTTIFIVTDPALPF